MAPTWFCATSPRPRASRRGPRDARSCRSTCSTGCQPRGACRRQRRRRSARARDLSELSQHDGGDAGGVEARRSERVRAHARPAQARIARYVSDDVHRAERALGRLDYGAHADARARSSSPSAPAISPARTACLCGLPSTGSPHSEFTDRLRAPQDLLFEQPCTRARLPSAMVIPGGVAGSLINRRIAK